MYEESFISWLSLLVAIVSANVALYSVFLSRNTAEISRKMTQKQATLDFFEKHESENPVEFAKLLHVLVSKKDIWSDPTYMSELQSFISLLGRHEKLALGLKHQVFDEQIVFDAMAKDIVGIYQLTEPLIMQGREKMRMMSKMMGISLNEKAFCHFEELAKEYKARLATQE